MEAYVRFLSLSLYLSLSLSLSLLRVYTSHIAEIDR